MSENFSIGYHCCLFLKLHLSDQSVRCKILNTLVCNAFCVKITYWLIVLQYVHCSVFSLGRKGGRGRPTWLQLLSANISESSNVGDQLSLNKKPRCQTKPKTNNLCYTLTWLINFVWITSNCRCAKLCNDIYCQMAVSWKFKTIIKPSTSTTHNWKLHLDHQLH